MTPLTNNRMVRALSGGSVVGAYTYNGRGQRAIKQSAGKTTICHYDSEGRLIAETDEEGNLIREHFYLGSEPLGVFVKGTEQAGGEQYLFQGTDDVTGAAITVKLDVADRTIIIEDESGLVSQYVVPERYWRVGRLGRFRYTRVSVTRLRIRKSRREPIGIRGMFILRGDKGSGSITVTENGIYRRWRLTGERMADGGGGADQFYYAHNDHLGTPKILTDNKGTVAWSADYKPFGNVALTNESTTNNLRFPGQYYDQETGLHYNYHRYYDPRTGRYITPDPIGLSGGLNLFLYSDVNPTNKIDPNGLSGYGIEQFLISMESICIPLTSKKTDWKIAWRGQPKYDLRVTFADEFGAVGAAHWKKYTKVGEERTLIERLLCFECDECGCRFVTTNSPSKPEIRYRWDMEQHLRRAYRIHQGQGPHSGDLWWSINPWNRQTEKGRIPPGP
ncbi:RHS repeat-associated core domain-containing protein [Thermodesulfobacteriota bacterium]